MQLVLRHLSFPRRLAVQPKNLPEFIFTRCTRSVNLVAENEDGTAGQLLVGQQGVQLDLALTKSGSIAAIDQEDDSIHSWEVIFPHPSGLVMTTQVERREPDSID